MKAMALEKGAGINVVDSVSQSNGRQAVAELKCEFANGFNIGGGGDFF